MTIMHVIIEMVEADEVKQLGEWQGIAENKLDG